MEILRGYVFESRGYLLYLTGIIKANVLIDETEHARLADFDLLAITSEGTNLISSTWSSPRGTHRWMSPELLDPDSFDLKDSRPTNHSHYYALGMVIYEVLSERIPFFRCRGHKDC